MGLPVMQAEAFMSWKAPEIITLKGSRVTILGWANFCLLGNCLPTYVHCLCSFWQIMEVCSSKFRVNLFNSRIYVPINFDGKISWAAYLHILSMGDFFTNSSRQPEGWFLIPSFALFRCEIFGLCRGLNLTQPQ
jgi:hypothetical protein